MTTPKKYIDLYEDVTENIYITHGSKRGIIHTLSFLDRNPDQVPGRTITEGEREGSLEDAPPGFRFGWDTGFAAAGGRIAPDPEPTNAQSIDKLLTEFAHLNASCGGEWGDHDLAEFLDARGVKAGGDDE